MSAPDLTVVVTIVEGGAALTRCLEALSRQIEAPAMEVIVPFDDTIRGMRQLGERFPEYRFADLGPIAAPDSPSNAYTQHVLYDRRRSGGLRTARGRLVAMLEDRGWPRPDWAKTIVNLHDSMPHAAIGGAIESGAVGTLRSAAFFCDFGRYEPPLEDRDVEYLSDINICYKRAALESVRALWEHRYQEATVNWALRRQGLRLHLADKPRVVEQRGPMHLWTALTERVHWGRTFGYVRGREVSRMACLLRAVAAPLVPVVLLWRHLRKQFRIRREATLLIRALPATFGFMLFWSIGEMIGELEAVRAPRNSYPRLQNAANAEVGAHHERFR